MKDELREWLAHIAGHPAAYGFAAAVARWWLGDREGGWRAFVGYLACSLLVAWATWLYLADEGMTHTRSGFWSREYTNGLVVVRPKGADNATWATAGDADYTLPFDVVELTGTLNPEDQGRVRLAGTTVPFAPRSARIFLRA